MTKYAIGYSLLSIVISMLSFLFYPLSEFTLWVIVAMNGLSAILSLWQMVVDTSHETDTFI